MTASTPTGPTEPRWLARAVTAVVCLVGLYDIAIGAYMLWAATPHAAHGPGTVWEALGPVMARGGDGGALAVGVEATLRRMGAFSLHAGVVTCVWAAYAYARPGVRTALFLTYVVTGMGFFTTDSRFFADTDYHHMKQWIGHAFTAAMLLHFWGRWGRWGRA